MDNTTALKRPKAEDNEEELFRMQEEFFKNNLKSSAKVINIYDKTNKQFCDTSSNIVKCNVSKTNIKSKFSELKKFKADQCTASQTVGEMINPIVKKQIEESLKKQDDPVQNIPTPLSNIILGNIVERKYNGQNFKFDFNKRSFSKSVETGFPQVFISNNYMNASSSQSLFSKELRKKECIDKNSKTFQSKNVPDRTQDNESVLIEGSWAAEIHKANLEKLSQMTKAEILQEKNNLEALISPDLKQFLKDRKNRKKKLKNPAKYMESADSEINKGAVSAIQLHEKESNDSCKSDNAIDIDCDTNIQNAPKSCIEILKQAKKEKWVHIDTIESEKLKWMEDVPMEEKDKPNVDEFYNARFDFNGVLLPYKDENLSINKGLHHHGEEPERPGYSLQELLQLSRSSTQQQRCIALTTLANIIEKSRMGWYDKTLQPAPLIALHEKNVLLLLRFSLDDTSVAVVTATLQTLRAFLFSEADEICLDRLYGWNKYTEPTLMPSREVRDDNNLKDHELVQLDAIAALLRSDIILRIRYVLSEMHPPPVGVTCSLEILIRLARYSSITALNIACTPNLLNIIIQNFMPLSTDKLATSNTINNVYGVPLVNAIRLCRILVCYGGKVVAQKLFNLKIMQPILSYITSETGKLGINLSIESLRLWRILLYHGVAIDSVSGAQLTFVSQLQVLLSSHNIGSMSELTCEYATALIAVASTEMPLKECIFLLLAKWSTQLSSVSSPNWHVMKLIAQSLMVANDISTFKTSWMYNSHVTSKLCANSNLLNNCVSAIEREPTALPNLGVLTQDGRLQPIVSEESCIPFLTTIVNVLCDHLAKEDIEAILNWPEFTKYIQKLESTCWCLERSWYTRMEFNFLIAIVKATSLIKDRLNSETKHLIWKITIKLISSLPADYINDVKDMLKEAFSEEKLNLEIITNELPKLNLNTSNEQFSSITKHNVATLYEKYITAVPDWNQAAMPKDWLYLPLIYIYTKCKNNDTFTEEDETNILVLLNLEIILPDLVEQLSPSLRFSRLVLVYLCDTVYLNKDVSALLTKAMSVLIRKYYNIFDFTKSLPGLNSFVDLFTVMCECFYANSYGNYGFAMALLVPIAQRHDVHYRKLLWSEHAGVLRYLRLPLDKLEIPLREYIDPIEEDVSLIESYLTSLIRGTVKPEWCPILYTIAIHHSAMYLKRSSKLAVRMKTQIEKIQNKNLSDTLLNYTSLI